MTLGRTNVCLTPDVAAAYAAGHLSDDQLASVGEHIDGCSTCRQVLSAAAQLAVTGDSVPLEDVASGGDPAPLILEKASVISRYVIDGWLGAGGMGVVYVAHDPVLKRKVALKVLRDWLTHAARTSLSEELLRREAMAMARLAHTNVVGIYDLFRSGDALYIVMEFIEGTTLAKWLRRDASHPRPFREIVAALTLAGRGLSAAHAEGVVHRDFKPDNVLVATSGRICVSDFGLSRVASEVTGEVPSSRGRAALVSKHAGTPRYMSPEQYRGEPTTAKSDQFSFSVTLYEALYGEHPFHDTRDSGESYGTSWVIRPPPSGSRVPPWLYRCVRRGLSERPELRYPSLDEMLVDMQRDPKARRRRLITGALALMAIVGGGFVTHQRSLAAEREACAHFDRDLVGVWDDAAKRGLAAGIDALRRGPAKERWGLVTAALDRKAAQWVLARNEVCETMRENRVSSDPRLTCLSDRLDELRAVVTELPTALAHEDDASAVLSVGSQLSVESCRAGAGQHRAFGHATTQRPDIAANGPPSALARARTLGWLGYLAESAAAAEEAVQDATAHGDRERLALSLELAGNGRALTGEQEKGRRELESALSIADAASDDETRADVCADLVYLSAMDPASHANPAALAQAKGWYAEGMAAAERFGDPDKTSEARLHDRYGVLLAAVGNYGEAIDQVSLAIAAWEKKGPNELLALGLSSRGTYEGQRGELRKASEDLERSGALLSSSSASNQAFVASNWNNLASVLLADNEIERAHVAAQRSVSTYASMATGERLDATAAECTLGETLLELGRYDEALVHLQASAEALERLHAPEPFQIEALADVGRVYVAVSRPDHALPYLERAATPENGDPEYLADARFALARALVGVHRDAARARVLAASARALLEKIPTRTPLQQIKLGEMVAWMPPRG